MILTSQKNIVTTPMMRAEKMSRKQYAVPVDPRDKSKGLIWKTLLELNEGDYAKIEEYFIQKTESKTIPTPKNLNKS